METRREHQRAHGAGADEQELMAQVGLATRFTDRE
jgi:hypothetical protein